jgi:hypothetical protein
MQQKSPTSLPALLSLGYQNERNNLSSLPRYITNGRAGEVEYQGLVPVPSPSFTFRHHFQEIFELGTRTKLN